MEGMMSDDSALVDNILSELNQSSGNTQQQITQDTLPHPITQMTQPMGVPSVTMMNHQETQQGPTMSQTQKSEVMDVIYEQNESSYSQLLMKFRRPLIITLVCFLVFNPMILPKISKYLPVLSNVVLNSQYRVLLFSAVVGVVCYLVL